MNTDHLHPRFAVSALADALADTPVVLIHGPRQCGKTTLALGIAESRGYAYFSFDDAVALGAAIADPVGFVADLPDHAILDEVQRVSALPPAWCCTTVRPAWDSARGFSRCRFAPCGS